MSAEIAQENPDQLKVEDRLIQIGSERHLAWMAQQQDPAHDQSAFLVRAPAARFSAAESGPLFGSGALVIDGSKVADIRDCQITVFNEVDPLYTKYVLGDAPKGTFDVTGTFTAYFSDPKLYQFYVDAEREHQRWIDRILYGPVWRRELLWMLHNVVAHPLSELCYWLGFMFPPIRDFGNWFHDLTVPPHAPNTGRG